MNPSDRQPNTNELPSITNDIDTHSNPTETGADSHTAVRRASQNLLENVSTRQAQRNQPLLNTNINSLASNQSSSFPSTNVYNTSAALLARGDVSQALMAARLGQITSGVTSSFPQSTSTDYLARLILQQRSQTQSTDQSVNDLSDNSLAALSLHRAALSRAATDRNEILGLTRPPSNLADLRLPSIYSNSMYLSNAASLASLPYGLQDNIRLNYAPPLQHSAVSQTQDTVSAQQQQSSASLPSPEVQKGRPATFINKLYQMLLDLESQPGGTDIAAFISNGTAFVIHKPDVLLEHVLPKYFHMSSYSSFQRQLNMYNFRQLSSGTDKGIFYHELFVRGQPQLLRMIKRVQRKTAPESLKPAGT